ncbi:MAG: hypothetical protein R3C56_36220 [Pirellulaceae bacterium]
MNQHRQPINQPPFDDDIASHAMCHSPDAAAVFRTGEGAQMQARSMNFTLHHAKAFTSCTLWVTWLPLATQWTGKGPPD